MDERSTPGGVLEREWESDFDGDKGLMIRVMLIGLMLCYLLERGWESDCDMGLECV